jgi:hypothetical protein
LLDGFGLMNFIVIDDHIEPRVPVSQIARLEQGEQVSEERVRFPWP